MYLCGCYIYVSGVSEIWISEIKERECVSVGNQTKINKQINKRKKRVKIREGEREILFVGWLSLGSDRLLVAATIIYTAAGAGFFCASCCCCYYHCHFGFYDEKSWVFFFLYLCREGNE